MNFHALGEQCPECVNKPEKKNGSLLREGWAQVYHFCFHSGHSQYSKSN